MSGWSLLHNGIGWRSNLELFLVVLDLCFLFADFLLFTLFVLFILFTLLLDAGFAVGDGAILLSSVLCITNIGLLLSIFVSTTTSRKIRILKMSQQKKRMPMGDFITGLPGHKGKPVRICLDPAGSL